MLPIKSAAGLLIFFACSVPWAAPLVIIN